MNRTVALQCSDKKTGLESILDDSGKLILAQETRTVIDELRLELTKSPAIWP